jgi:hypothetical protein
VDDLLSLIRGTAELRQRSLALEGGADLAAELDRLAAAVLRVALDGPPAGRLAARLARTLRRADSVRRLADAAIELQKAVHAARCSPSAVAAALDSAGN